MSSDILKRAYQRKLALEEQRTKIDRKLLEIDSFFEVYEMVLLDGLPPTPTTPTNPSRR
jgi:hypothetical protein